MSRQNTDKALAAARSSIKAQAASMAIKETDTDVLTLLKFLEKDAGLPDQEDIDVAQHALKVAERAASSVENLPRSREYFTTLRSLCAVQNFQLSCAREENYLRRQADEHFKEGLKNKEVEAKVNSWREEAENIQTKCMDANKRRVELRKELKKGDFLEEAKKAAARKDDSAYVLIELMANMLG